MITVDRHLIRVALLQAISKRTNHRPNVFISSKGIIQEAVQLLGWDENNPTKYGFSPKRMNISPNGMYRYVHHVLGHMRFRKVPYVVRSTYGQWSLTSDALVFLDAQKPIIKNYTVEFLNTLIASTGGTNGTFMKGMRAAVAHKLPVSANARIVEDHIQNYFVKVMSHDTFREKILEGKPPTISKIKSYAVQSAITDIRGDGCNPVCRSLYGASTATERVKGVKGHYSPFKLAVKKDQDEKIQDWEIAQVAQEEQVPLEEIESKDILFETTWKNVRKIAGKNFQFPRKARRVMELKMDGFEKDEIALKTKLDIASVEDILSKTKKCMKEIIANQ